MTKYRDNLKAEYFSVLNEVRYFHDSDAQAELVMLLCKNIIDSILSVRSPEKLLNINIHRMSKFAKSSNEDTLKLATYFLSLPPLSIIDWVYEANNIFSNSGHCDEEVLELEQTYITYAVNKQEYVNPFNGEFISKEQFEDMINVVFRVSNEFVLRYNKVRG
ncbi:hypothetical protein [Psychrobacter sp. ANT_WB68]|uniref:hypothetical protein n=1 Tax=Psychrobacter sp. ANT_WB68 TaxID=2597355 RepID=UPI0011F2C21A|nr:hypothetical protein [Psychrobacter sp. ANT_WB68]KAA0913108.1 hypothetical protein FQ084_11495 [Psychrobacter sp. ANT_WB68]